LYAENGNNVYVNLFTSSAAKLKVNGKQVEIIQQNDYPWKGLLNFTVNPQNTTDFNLLVRIPGWVRNEAIPSDLYHFENNTAATYSIKVNGKPVKCKVEKGYAVLSRKWNKGDRVQVDLPMPVRKVEANAALTVDAGKAALQRGPIMYCAEWKDNNGQTSNLSLPASASFKTQYEPALLNGVVVLKGQAVTVNDDNQQSTTLTAIPYYAWANRGEGEMQIWFPELSKRTAVTEKSK
jgi:DUF1680 family protein